MQTRTRRTAAQEPQAPSKVGTTATNKNNHDGGNGKKRKAESSLNNRGAEVEDKGAIGFQKKKLKKNEVVQRQVTAVTDPKVTIILSKYTSTNKNPTTPTISSLNKQQTPKGKPTVTFVNPASGKKQPTIAPKEEVSIPKRVTRARNVPIK